MARTTFDGPVRSLNGFLGTGPNMAASITGTVDGGTDIAGIDAYQGKIIQVGNANTVFNLPSIIDTADGASAGGSDPSNLNRVGIKYHFIMTANLTVPPEPLSIKSTLPKVAPHLMLSPTTLAGALSVLLPADTLVVTWPLAVNCLFLRANIINSKD